jgi:hypothetical protein
MGILAENGGAVGLADLAEALREAPRGYISAVVCIAPLSGRGRARKGPEPRRAPVPRDLPSPARKQG